MKSWKVRVKDGSGKEHSYWVEAETQELAEARGYRLHCASSNWGGGARAYVVGSEEIPDAGGAA